MHAAISAPNILGTTISLLYCTRIDKNTDNNNNDNNNINNINNLQGAVQYPLLVLCVILSLANNVTFTICKTVTRTLSPHVNLV